VEAPFIDAGSLIMKIARDRVSNVLALDLATCTGFAIGALGERPRHGAIMLRGQEPVHRQAALREWLDDQDKLKPIQAVVVEAALIGQFSSNAAEYLTLALHSTLALWCYDLEIPLFPIASSTVRSGMLGTSRFKKGTAKDHVVFWCKANGYAVATHDAADAILTWSYVEAQTLGYQRAARGLFSTQAKGAA
jgi:hypothetical protein